MKLKFSIELKFNVELGSAFNGSLGEEGPAQEGGEKEQFTAVECNIEVSSEVSPMS